MKKDLYPQVINLIKDRVYRVPPEFCTSTEIAHAYLQGRVHEREEILKLIKDKK